MSATPEDLEAAYAARRPQLTRLCEEVRFSLDGGLAASGIKTHSVAARVKSSESLVEKARRKEYGDPLTEVTDMVGARVVTLFLSDLSRVESIVRDRFEVVKAEDTVQGERAEVFGYMSHHYVAELRREHTGPRYEGLHGQLFEIQVRTIVMDAWASVSHYLDYKGEASLPAGLRRDFLALSGLFYIADQHFESFTQEAARSRESADELVKEAMADEIAIDLDTMEAYLHDRYPDRVHSARRDVSEFVEEVTEHGYRSLSGLEAALAPHDEPFLAYERIDGPVGRTYYADLGAARVTLALADPEYADFKYPADSGLRAFRENHLDESS